MARGAWQQTSQLASILAMPEEGRDPYTPADFNPFLVGVEKDKSANLHPYDPQHLQNLQDGM